MRKTAEITIVDEGRDKGKTFLITEMAAMDGERWAARALGILARTGVDVTYADIQGGWQALTALGVRAALLALGDEAFPLIDEMTQCIQIKEALVTRDLQREDIEEVVTLLRLRDEVLNLHTGFSIAAALSNQAAALKALIESSSTLQTSATQLEQSSPFG